MNNEEKAKEIVNKFIPNDDFDTAMKYDLAKIALLQMAQWKDEQTKHLYEIIIKLWDMLDWIDTYADLKINGSENDVYFGEIEDKTRERFAFVKSDGYDLFINNEKKITNNGHNTTKTDYR